MNEVERELHEGFIRFVSVGKNVGHVRVTRNMFNVDVAGITSMVDGDLANVEVAKLLQHRASLLAPVHCALVVLEHGDSIGDVGELEIRHEMIEHL